MKWSVCNHSLILLAWVLSTLAHVSLFVIVSSGFKHPLEKTRILHANISYKALEAEKNSELGHASPARTNNPAKKSKFRKTPETREFLGHEASSYQKSDISNSQIIIRTEPLLINGQHVLVPYPPKARRYKIEGKVRLRLVVAQNGQVIKTEILSCPSYDLQAAALSVAQKLLFLPATDNSGVAKIAEVEHEVIFRLNKPS